MKAIILAAGKSTRTYPLTITKPKPLLKVANKLLIEHNISQFEDIVDEVIIVIGYKGDMIKKVLGERYNNIKIRYIEQKEQLGTGHALLQIKDNIQDEKFIVIMGDDLYFKKGFDNLIKYDLAVLAKKVKDYSSFGVFKVKENKMISIIEKPKEFVSDLANTGCYLFDKRIFKKLKSLKESSRGEYELTDALQKLAETDDVFVIESNSWIPVGYPWDLLNADKIIRKGIVFTGNDTIITGEIVNSTIGNNCKIEGNVKNSIVGDNVKITKGSIIEDSIIGDHVCFGGVIKSSKMIDININDKIIKVENFGAVVGDGCKLDNIIINPGSMVWPDKKKSGKEIRGIIK